MQNLAGEFFKRLSDVFWHEPWVKIMPGKTWNFHPLHRKNSTLSEPPVIAASRSLAAHSAGALGRSSHAHRLVRWPWSSQAASCDAAHVVHRCFLANGLSLLVGILLTSAERPAPKQTPAAPFGGSRRSLDGGRALYYNPWCQADPTAWPPPRARDSREAISIALSNTTHIIRPTCARIELSCYPLHFGHWNLGSGFLPVDPSPAPTLLPASPPVPPVR